MQQLCYAESNPVNDDEEPMNLPLSDMTDPVGLPSGASLAVIADVLFSYSIRIGMLRRMPDNAPMNPEITKSDLLELFSILAARKIPFMLVGGMAMNCYIPERLTRDIDLIMAKKDLQALPEVKLHHETNSFGNGQYKSIPVDILFAEDRFFRTIKEHFSVALKLAEQTIDCATVDGLLAMKLYALPSLYVQGNLTKVQRYEKDLIYLLNAEKTANVDRAMEAVKPHVSDAQLTELNNIIKEIERVRSQQQERAQRMLTHERKR